jgi:hypothetical protein
MAQNEKVRENLLRRMAERQGYEFHKSRRRDPRATDYGKYTLVPAKGKPREFASIDDLEKFLNR